MKKDEVKFQQSPFPVDTPYEIHSSWPLPLFGEELKKIEKSHGRSLNHWVGGLMHITFQTFCDLQYLTMLLSVYTNAPTEPDFIAFKHGMEYLMHHPHEPIMYSRFYFIKLIKTPPMLLQSRRCRNKQK